MFSSKLHTVRLRTDVMGWRVGVDPLSAPLSNDERTAAKNLASEHGMTQSQAEHVMRLHKFHAGAGDDRACIRAGEEVTVIFAVQWMDQPDAETILCVRSNQGIQASTTRGNTETEC
jgi:hypothetical protein